MQHAISDGFRFFFIYFEKTTLGILEAFGILNSVFS